MSGADEDGGAPHKRQRTEAPTCTTEHAPLRAAFASHKGRKQSLEDVTIINHERIAAIEDTIAAGADVTDNS